VVLERSFKHKADKMNAAELSAANAHAFSTLSKIFLRPICVGFNTRETRSIAA